MCVYCPNCSEEVDDWSFQCDYPCSTSEVWWCSVCGAIAYTWNCDEPDDEDWYAPTYTKKEYDIDESVQQIGVALGYEPRKKGVRFVPRTMGVQC